MTRAGRAVGWKSRGLAKDSEEGKRGALEGKEGKGGNGGGQGGNVRRGDRSLIGATFSGHQRQQQQPGFCQTPRLADTATPSYCPTHPPGAPGAPHTLLVLLYPHPPPAHVLPCMPLASSVLPWTQSLYRRQASKGLSFTLAGSLSA